MGAGADRKTILVTGATGTQGGSVARHLLNGGEFAVRGLTRNPHSATAEILRQAGAEVREGDLANPQSLAAALEGCYGVFGVTNYWEHFAQEEEHGKNLVDAVKEARVSHFVFSTLPGAKKISHDEIDVPHLDIKARLEDYARGAGLDATFVHVALYYENFLTFFPPSPQEDGSFAFGFPQGETSLAGVAAHDIGGVVAAIFDHPAELKGQTVGIVGEDSPPAAYAAAMTRVLRKQVAYHHVPKEMFASFGFPGADDLANMFEFNRRFIPDRKADLQLSRTIYPRMQSFEKWLLLNRAKFSEILEDAKV